MDLSRGRQGSAEAGEGEVDVIALCADCEIGASLTSFISNDHAGNATKQIIKKREKKMKWEGKKLHCFRASAPLSDQVDTTALCCQPIISTTMLTPLLVVGEYAIYQHIDLLERNIYG